MKIINIKINDITVKIDFLEGEYYAFFLKNINKGNTPKSLRGLLKILTNFYGKQYKHEIIAQLKNQLGKIGDKK